MMKYKLLELVSFIFTLIIINYIINYTNHHLIGVIRNE